MCPQQSPLSVLPPLCGCHLWTELFAFSTVVYFRVFLVLYFWAQPRFLTEAIGGRGAIITLLQLISPGLDEDGIFTAKALLCFYPCVASKILKKSTSQKMQWKKKKELEAIDRCVHTRVPKLLFDSILHLYLRLQPCQVLTC